MRKPNDASRRGAAPLFVIVSLLGGLLLAQALSAAESKGGPPAAALSVTQIVDRHIAARGGLAAWSAVQTLSVAGKLEAGTGDSLARSRKLALQGVGASVKRAERAQAAAETAKAAQVQLPFRLEMKRPHKSRVEVEFAGQTAVQVYDGEHGWKLRPFLNRNDVDPFTEDEAKSAAAEADLDGPLVGYAAKGTQVALDGTERVDGHNAYKLKLTLRNGDVRHVWIDAQSFLDVKVEGSPRRMDGKMRSVWVYQRDFRSVQGRMVPYLYETAVEGTPHTHRMMVESVTVNPPLADTRFSKPQVLVAASPSAATPGPASSDKK
jgi:hypothetical protein